MRKYIKKRLWQLVPILIGVSLISFFVMHLAPGDPTALFVNPNIEPQELARVRANWGLDQPIYVQYIKWLWNAVRLDFGRSYLTGRAVVVEIAERLPATLLLMISSLILTVLITIPLGVISAVKKGSLADNLITLFAFAGMSIPSFWSRMPPSWTSMAFTLVRSCPRISPG